MRWRSLLHHLGSSSNAEPSFAISALLIASALNLALMVPGGFVETRDFSAYPAVVLGAFNVFLTVLGLGSLVLAYVVVGTGRGNGWAVLFRLAFIGVYLLDLWRIFPVPANPMSTLLATLEWLGTGLGVALTILSIALRGATNTTTLAKPTLPITIWAERAWSPPVAILTP
ncbi:MAG: hypothetical protein KKD64_14960 [Alphaproteobacteria bacterium]|nr:hypothetical protein [Alphaproteobacteria bacterium]MBU0793556.1 hypothetical protein [Alphaproteobacteria bacterium]MBU0876407.1 hypothetical protein [Alphaproteobacteria bacterium]MBU1770936.1 hypothetical protein [Alphaproteobacteria bacterium]